MAVKSVITVDDKWNMYACNQALLTAQSVYEKLSVVYRPNIVQMLMLDLSEVHSVDVIVSGTVYVIQWHHYSDKFTVSYIDMTNCSFWEM